MGCFKRTSEMEKGNTRRRGLCILLLVLIVWLNNHDFLQPCKQHFETFYYRKPSCAETRYFCRLWRRSSSIRCIWEEVKLPPPNSKIQTLQLERRVLSQWKATTFTGDETQGELSLRVCLRQNERQAVLSLLCRRLTIPGSSSNVENKETDNSTTTKTKVRLNY